MKKVLLIVAVITSFSVTANAQNKVTMDSLIHEVQVLRQELHEADSINKLYLDGIYRNNDKPRFKMYQTDNIYNLLKLDTRTGRVWIVQYGMKDVKAQVSSINYFGRVLESEGWDGRFELYPTKNKYNFIMLDTGTGDTYQVQWDTDPSYRFVVPID